MQLVFRIAILALSAALGVDGILREAPWEDEYFSLRALEGGWGYRFIPVYFAWLKTGALFSENLVWLRLWSFAPFLAGLAMVDGLLRRWGVRPEVALLTLALLAINPWLVHECRSVRYYGMLFLASILALRAITWLASPAAAMVSSRRRVFVWGLVALPQLVLYSGAGLIAVMVGWWIVRTRNRGARRLGAPASILLGVGVLLTWPLWFPLRKLRFIVTSDRWNELPVDLGYPKGPVDAPALAFQYEQLLGLGPLEWWAPAALVEGGAVVLVAVGGWAALRRSRCEHRSLLLAIAAVPAFAWAASPVVNLLGTRWYLYAALPLAWMTATAVHQAWRSGGIVGRAAAATIVGVLLASTAASRLHPTDPSLQDLARELTDRNVVILHVEPPWYAKHVARYLARNGCPTVVGSLPEEGFPRGYYSAWLFVKSRGYVWEPPSAGYRRLPHHKYEEIARLPSLRRYYFHEPRPFDVLLFRRP